jgi:hypothetical protein
LRFFEKKADKMKSKERIKDIGEVFTPQHIVNDMVDLIPDLTIATTVLEPSVGEGVFLCEILQRKLRTVRVENLRPIQICSALQTLYGVDIMLDNVQKTRENLLRAVICHCGLDPQSSDNNDTITQWKQILQNNIRWGDTLACFEAKTENHNDIICLKDLYKEDLTDLQFFNYQKNILENYISPINEEIKQQRDESTYRTPNTQFSLF